MLAENNSTMGPVYGVQQIDKQGRSYGTGRRKEAVARVWVKPGTGKFVVNGMPDLSSHLKHESFCVDVCTPFRVCELIGRFDVFATVKGGGLSGQAGALRLGVSRALEKFNPMLRPALKKNGLLTRDSRVVERKKYGKRKARRSCQFSKR